MLPRVLHRLAIVIAQLSIVNPVVIHPGAYIAHGQTIIDEYTEIDSGVVIAPWSSIGLVAGNPRGPIIGRGVKIGTEATVLGPVVVHRGARIGADAVVARDVPENTTVLGAPVRHVPLVDTRWRSEGTGDGRYRRRLPAMHMDAVRFTRRRPNRLFESEASTTL